MNRPLATFTRIIAALCGIGLLAVIMLPLWRIELDAPQYPEGLVLKIYPDRLGGDVDVVNGLNHYIGMRTLHAKDFVEFTVLPWIIGILGVLGVLAALVNKRWFFATWVILFLSFSHSLIPFFQRNYISKNLFPCPFLWNHYTCSPFSHESPPIEYPNIREAAYYQQGRPHDH